MRIKLLLLAALFACTAGCAAKPRPPIFSLYERERIVVLPFQNATPDQALAQTIQDEVLVFLVRLNAVPVAEQAQVATMIETMAAAGTAGEEGLRKQLTDAFKCDVIMVGSINTYSEDLTKSDPRRIKKSYKHNTYKWGYSDVARVHIDVTLKLIDAKNGNILWIKKAQGAGRGSRWRDLAWPGEKTTPPPPEDDNSGVHAKKGKNGRGRGKGDQPQTPPPASVPPTVAASPQPITIIINNTQQNQQLVQQKVEQKVEQKQEQSQTQAQAAGTGVAAPRELLYERDSNVYRARQYAISTVVRNAMRDFRGRGGWHPGIEKAASKTPGTPQKK